LTLEASLFGLSDPGDGGTSFTFYDSTLPDTSSPITEYEAEAGVTSIWVRAQNTAGCITDTVVQVVATTLEVDLMIVDSLTCQTTGQLQVAPVNGSGAVSYIWELDGQDLAEIGAIIPFTASGTYVVQATDTLGCTATDTLRYTLPPTLQLSLENDSLACAEDSDGQLELILSGGTAPYQIEWVGLSANNTLLTNLTSGDYTAIITDAQGCVDSISASVFAPEALEFLCSDAQGITTLNAADGQITFDIEGGTAPYQVDVDGVLLDYNLPGSYQIATLAANNYTATITDANGCVGTCSFTIPDINCNLQIEALLTQNLSCFDASDGQLAPIVTGGTGPFTFEWSDAGISDSIRTNLAAGDYALTVTDLFGCSQSIQATLTQPAPLVAGNLLSTDPTCTGLDNGTLGLDPNTISGGTAPYAFSWNDPSGQETPLAIGLAAGDYIVTVTDAQGCTIEVTGTLFDPDALILEANLINEPSCRGFSDGAIEVNVTNFSGAYQLDWTDNLSPLTNQTEGKQLLSDLPANVYVFVVTDFNNCAASDTLELTDADTLILAREIETIQCFGDTNGSINYIVSGGAGNFSYDWNDDSFDGSPFANGLSAGTYTFTLTDARQCLITDSLILTQPDSLELGLVVDSLICPEDVGAIALLPGGGTGPYTYLWTGGQTDSALIALGPQSYGVTLTDAQGCTQKESVTLAPAFPLNMEIEMDMPTLSCEATEVAVQAIFEVGQTPFSYQWTDETGTIVGTENSILVDEGGWYTLQFTDSRGCAPLVDSIFVEARLQQPQVDILSADDTLDCNQNSLLLEGTDLIFPNSEINYSWLSPNGNIVETSSVVATEAGTYLLIGEHVESGCADTLTYTVFEEVYPDATADLLLEDCDSVATLFGNSDLPEYVFGEWMITAGSIDDATALETNWTFAQAGTGLATWTLSTDRCPEFSSATVEIDRPELIPCVPEIESVLVGRQQVTFELSCLDDLNTGWQVGDILNPVLNPLNCQISTYSGGTLQYDPITGIFTYTSPLVAPQTMFDTVAIPIQYQACDWLVDTLYAPVELEFPCRNEEAIFIPNVISPFDGNGQNDCFVIDYLNWIEQDDYLDESCKQRINGESELVIVNRWGDAVFEASPYRNDWRGTYNGQPLPQGTYYYQLRIGPPDFGMVLTGWVTIVE